MNRLRPLIALLCAVGLLAGCGGNSESTTADGGTRVVHTVQGDVAIPTAPRRVVLLNYALAGYLYRLGQPVVAMTTEYTDKPSQPFPAWSDAFAKNGTVFLDWPASGFNIEAIAARKPDLIVGGGLGFPFKQGQDAYSKLSTIAPTVLVDNKLENWQGQFEFLANAFGKPEVYTAAVNEYDTRLAAVKSNITVPTGPVSYVSLVEGGKAYALIENRGLPLDFSRLGFRAAPVFASGRFTPYRPGGDSFEVSPELLGSTLNQPTMFVIGFHSDAVPVAKLQQNPVWAALPAFRDGGAHNLPYWVQRPDFDHALATLDVVQTMFPKR